MKTVTEHIRSHIIRHLGLEPFGAGLGVKGDDLEHILEQQLDWEFLKGVALKSVMGWYRYGNNHDPSLPRHDHVKRIRVELGRYEATGNIEHLEEIAIYAMLEAIKAPLGRGSLPPERVHRRFVDDTESDPNLHAVELQKETR